MTYETFRAKVLQGLQDRELGNVSLRLTKQMKSNGQMKYGIVFKNPATNTSPAIYLEEYYQQFQGGSSVEHIAGEILRLYKEVRFRRSFEGEFIKDYQNVRRKIIYRLVNREANKELLKEVPYEEYLDLAVIFYVLIEVNSHGMASLMIRDEHLEMWNVTKSEIARKAKENTPRLLPYEFGTMYALIEELTGEDGGS